MQRDQDPEFFVVIRYIMVANARTHVSQGNLWEAVLRDTFNQILSQPNDPAQQTVVENIKNYIDVVHRDGYTSDLMQCESTYLLWQYILTLTLTCSCWTVSGRYYT